MKIRQSKFAALCGISRSAINQVITKGLLEKGEDGLLDTDSPVNSSYILRHTGGRPIAIEDQKPPKEPKAPKPVKARKVKSADHVPDAGKVIPPDTSNKPDPGAILRAIASSGSIPPTVFPCTDLTPAEMQTIARRALFEAQKIQRDSELKALALDKEHGNLIDREIFDTFAMEMMQAIQQGFIDVIPKQALLICSRLGAVGHEAEVEDCINNDHKRRLEEVKRIVETHLRKRYYQKPEPKRAIPEDTE